MGKIKLKRFKKEELVSICELYKIEISNSNGENVKAAAYPNPAISPDIIAIPVGGGQSTGSYTKDVGSNIYSILDQKFKF